MKTRAYKAPVLLFTYRKPQFLEEILSIIEDYSPPRLYITSNYPLSEQERPIVESIRRTIKACKLPCEIHFIFHDSHLLINESIHAGLDHVLSVEESIIVLEDDTVPSKGFFDFCNKMLKEHQQDTNVGSIIGCNLGAESGEEAYETPLALFYWGWATWADRWKSQKTSPIRWEAVTKELSSRAERHQSRLLHFLKKMDDRTTWDIRWAINQLLRDQKIILPGKNLVINKGFVSEGSYIRFNSSAFKNIDLHNTCLTLEKPQHCTSFSMKYEELTANLIQEILTSRHEYNQYFSDFMEN